MERKPNRVQRLSRGGSPDVRFEPPPTLETNTTEIAALQGELKFHVFKMQEISDKLGGLWKIDHDLMMEKQK